MTEPRTLRIYLSAADDVRPERLIAERVLTRLERAFSAFLKLEIHYWERAPLAVDAPHQNLEVLPGDADLFVMILWSRLGPILEDPDFRGAMSGGQMAAVEWEFEDALAAHHQQGGPDLMLFQKAAPLTTDLADGAGAEAARRHLDRLRDFTDHWFADPQMASNLMVDVLFPDAGIFEAELESRVYEWLHGQIDPEAEPAIPDWYQGRPYRGLAPYGIEDSPMFFGRAKARMAMRDQLARQVRQGRPGVMLVLGASGSGKTSLVEAGLVADLGHPGMIDGIGKIRHGRFSPGDRDGDPLGGLVSTLLADDVLPELRAPRQDEQWLRDILVGDQDNTVEELAGVIGVALDRVAADAGLVQGADARVVLVVDQLEELFLPPLGGQRGGDALVRALSNLAHTGLVWVVAVMRSDYMDRLEKTPGLMALMDNGSRYHMMPPDVEELSQMIRGPAIEAGLTFEVDADSGAALEDQILTDAVRTMSLPVLSLAMDRLWRGRDQNSARMTFAAYEDLGGQEDLLARHAEGAFRQMNEAEREAFPAVLRQLIYDFDASGAIPPLRSRAVTHFRDGTPERGVVDTLSQPEFGLIQVDGSGDWRRARIMHEVLLAEWPRIQAQLQKERDDRRILTWLKDAQALYRADNRADGKKTDLLVPAGRPLAEAEDLLARRGDELPEVLRSFVAMSRSHAGLPAPATPVDTGRDDGLSAPTAPVLSSDDGILASVGARFRAMPEKTRRNALYGGGGAALLLVAVLGAWGAASMFTGPATTPRPITPVTPPTGPIGTKPETPAVDTPELEAKLEETKSRLDHLLIAQSRYLLREAERALAAGDGEMAQNLVLESLPRPGGPERPRLKEAVEVMQSTLQNDRQLSLLVGHADSIRYVSWSPNGDRVATASLDGTVWVRDAATGVVQMVLRGHRGAVYSVNWSPDGDSARLITASEDGTARVWDGAQGKTTIVLEGHQEGSAVARAFWSPKGRRILTFSNDGTAKIWNGTTGEIQATLESGGGAVWSAAFSPKGRYIATGSGTGVLRIWDVEAPEKPIAEQTGLGNGIVQITWNQAGTRLLSVSFESDGAARVHDAKDGKVLTLLKAPGGSMTHADWSPDGNWIVTVQGNVARLWNGEEGGRRAQMDDHADHITHLAFSPDGTMFATSSKDGTVRLWDGSSGLSQGVLRGHQGPVRYFAWSPDGNQILSGDEGGVARQWIGRSRLARTVLGGHDGPVLQAVWSPNGKRLATADLEGEVRIWEGANRGKFVRLQGHDQPVRSIAWSQNGSQVLTASDDRTARIWSADTGESLMVLQGHEEPVLTAEWSPDGTKVLTASVDRTARLWDLASGKVAKTLSGHEAAIMRATFSPGGNRILTVSRDRTGRLWNAETGESTVTLTGLDHPAITGAWSPDGAMLAIAGEDGTIRLWTAENGTPVGILGDHEGPIRDLAWSRDSQRLLSVGNDRIGRIWAVAKGEVLHRLEGHKGDILFGAWSRGGDKVATVSNDGTARIWNAQTGQILSILRGHDGPVRYAAWSIDDQELITTSDDRTVRVWDATQGPTVVPSASDADMVPPFADGWGRTWVGLSHDQLVTYLRATSFRPLSAAARAQHFLDDEVEQGPSGAELTYAENCDRLAADPYDPQRPGPGVSRNTIRAEAAIAACAKAVAEQPQNGRLLYQLGRAQMSVAQWDDARNNIQKALDQGYPAAAAGMAEIYYRGAGVAVDLQKALELWRRAHEAGMSVAGFEIAWRQWNGEGTDENRSAALTMWKSLADAGDPNSLERLGRIYSLGESVFQSTADAYFYYELARRGFDAIGDEVAARHSQLMRANLARGMDPVTVFNEEAKIRARLEPEVPKETEEAPATDAPETTPEAPMEPESPPDMTSEAPADQPVEAPLESPIETPVEAPVESPADTPVEAPSPDVAEQPEGNGDSVDPAVAQPDGEVPALPMPEITDDGSAPAAPEPPPVPQVRE